MAALFAVWRAGAVYVPVNPRLSPGEADHVVDEVGPVLAITTPEAADRFAVPVIVARTGGWLHRGSRPGRGPRHDADIAVISFTSGTTGRPKPVLMRHSGVLELLDGVIGSLRRERPQGRPSRRCRTSFPVSLSLWAGIYQVLFAFRVGAPS